MDRASNRARRTGISTVNNGLLIFGYVRSRNSYATEHRAVADGRVGHRFSTKKNKFHTGLVTVIAMLLRVTFVRTFEGILYEGTFVRR